MKVHGLSVEKVVRGIPNSKTSIRMLTDCVSVRIMLCGIQQAFLFSTFVLRVAPLLQEVNIFKPLICESIIINMKDAKNEVFHEKKALVSFS